MSTGRGWTGLMAAPEERRCCVLLAVQHRLYCALYYRPSSASQGLLHMHAVDSVPPWMKHVNNMDVSSHASPKGN